MARSAAHAAARRVRQHQAAAKLRSCLLRARTVRGLAACVGSGGERGLRRICCRGAVRRFALAPLGIFGLLAATCAAAWHGDPAASGCSTSLGESPGRPVDMQTDGLASAEVRSCYAPQLSTASVKRALDPKLSGLQDGVRACVRRARSLYYRTAALRLKMLRHQIASWLAAQQACCYLVGWNRRCAGEPHGKPPVPEKPSSKESRPSPGCHKTLGTKS